MDTVEIVMVVMAFVIVGIISAVVYLFRQTRLSDLEREIRKLSPDQIEAILLDAARIAYGAAEQIAERWENMSSTDKLDLAKRLLRALYEFKITGRPSDEALTAVMEHEVRLQHEAERQREAKAV